MMMKSASILIFPRKLNRNIVFHQRHGRGSIGRIDAKCVTNIEAIDHGTCTLGNAAGPLVRGQLFKRENEVRMQTARINTQEPARIFRLLRMHIESKPGGNGFLCELRCGKIDRNDGCDTFLRRLGPSDGGVEVPQVRAADGASWPG